MAILARILAAAGAFVALVGAAAAQDPDFGHAFPWQMQLQAPASLIMEQIVWFNSYTLVIVVAITLFVTLLIAWCIYRYNARANPTPSRVSHNTMVEVLWTVLPVLILVAIAIPSFRLLYAQYDPAVMYADFDPETTPFLTVKVTGNQWYWGLEYGVDEDSQANGVNDAIVYDMIMVPAADVPESRLVNLAVDNNMVVPVGAFVRLQVTGGDVIHAFGVPALGVKVDAVPGRLNEYYFRASREGVFYGQCYELCGKDHAFMPIGVQVVSPEQFEAWAGQAGINLQGAFQTLAAMIEADRNTELAAR